MSIGGSTVSGAGIAAGAIGNPLSSDVAVPNVAPTITIPSTPSADNGVALLFSGTISVADSDAVTLDLTLEVDHGTITLSGVDGLAFTAGNGVADATMTFTGTVAAINTALNGMIYTSSPAFTGTDTLTITANDGVASAVTENLSITVNFDPDLFGTVKVWYDPFDASTITSDVNGVSAVADKSVNVLHLAQATDTNKPSFSTDVLVFDGTDNFMTAGDAAAFRFLHDGSSWTAVWVANITDQANSLNCVFSEGSADTTQKCRFGVNSSGTDTQFAGTLTNSGNTTVQSFATPDGAVVFGAKKVYAARYVNGGSGVTSFWAFLNGTQTDSNTRTATNHTATGGSALKIGTNVATTGNFIAMSLGTFLIFTESLTDQEIADISAALMLRHGVT
jgi:hypothetical protein